MGLLPHCMLDYLWAARFQKSRRGINFSQSCRHPSIKQTRYTKTSRKGWDDHWERLSSFTSNTTWTKEVNWCKSTSMQVKNVSGKASTLRCKCTVGPSGRCKLHVQTNLKKKKKMYWKFYLFVTQKYLNDFAKQVALIITDLHARAELRPMQ